MNRIGRFEIPQRWLYVAAAVGLVVGIIIIYNLLTAGLQSYLALIAGSMLLIGNAPDLVRSLQRRDLGVAMLNSLIGGALISYFVGRIFLPPVFWPIAILMLALALPLTFNRAKVAGTYLNTFRLLLIQARTLLRLRSRSI